MELGASLGGNRFRFWWGGTKGEGQALSGRLGATVTKVQMREGQQKVVVQLRIVRIVRIEVRSNIDEVEEEGSSSMENRSGYWTLGYFPYLHFSSPHGGYIDLKPRTFRLFSGPRILPESH